MNKKIAVAVMGLLLSGAAVARAAQYASTNLANETGLAYNNTYTLNLTTFPSIQSGVGRVSAQIVYSSMSPANVTFNGGQLSTATITVVSTQPLVAAFATDKITVPTRILAQASTAQVTVAGLTNLGAGATSQITVLSTSGITGTTIFLNGAQSMGIAQGSAWAIGSSTSTTCTNIMNAINALSSYTNIVATCPTVTAGAIIYTTTTVYGALGRAYSITSTNGIVSTNTFTGGRDGAIVNVNGNQLINGRDWFSQSSTSETARSIATAMQSVVGAVVVTTCPTGTGSIIYSTASVAGLNGNLITIISTPSASLTPSATFYTGGAAPSLLNAVITFNGDAQQNGYNWSDVSGTSTGTAASIAAWLSEYGVIAATQSGSVVYATATVANSASNAFTLTSNNANLVVNSATFVGGQDSATVTINGFVLTAGSQNANGFAVGATTAATAINLSSAIVNNANIKLIVRSTETGNGFTAGVVYSTSIVIGGAANYIITTSTPALLASNGKFFGGSDSSTTINSAVIRSPAHGYTTGLQVGISTGTGVRLIPLNTGTTYYVVVVDSNNFALATSLANAVAGSTITITSSSTLTTAPTYTLRPVAVGGTPSWKWQVSNNGTDWTDLSTPAVYSVSTFVFPSTSTVVDFGDVDYQQLRMNVTAPTSGGLGLKVPITGRQ